ncbi:MAG: DOMON-like domain-containing protein [Azoarcus sp.]|nr:DOMON-like domain-containing protein [Azoarcus sp.]
MTSTTPPHAPKIPSITVGLRPFAAATEDEPPVSALLASFSVQPDGAMRLEYRLEGRLDALKIAAEGAPAPLPLWEHTCFEVFLSTLGEEGYREFNFSPDGQWSAAEFSRYRERVRFLENDGAPVIGMARAAGVLTLSVQLPPALLPAGPELRVGLAAVVERNDGRLDYWALRHPGDKPDFHHDGGWTLLLDTRLVAQ